MATNLSAGQTAELTPRQPMLGRARVLSLLVLLGLLTVCLAISWSTRDAMAHLPFLKGQKTQPDLASSSQTTIVDLHPWQIAQALAPLAVSSEEVEYAHEAERLADHEVNQAFAAALRQAGAQRVEPTGEALELSQKVAQLQQMAKEDQARVRSLTPAAPAAGQGAGDDLKIAQAQLDLDLDELNDAQHDLARATGDVRTRIQQELSAHQSAMSKMNAQSGGDSQIAVLSTKQYGTLAGRLEAWSSQRSRYQLIQQAIQQAKADATSVTMQHNALEALANESSAAAATGGKGCAGECSQARQPGTEKGTAPASQHLRRPDPDAAAARRSLWQVGQPGAPAASNRDAPDSTVAGDDCLHFNLRHPQ